MKRYLLLILFPALLFITCLEDESLPEGNVEARVSFGPASAPPPPLTDMRILIFDNTQTLIEEQRYSAYPTALRAPVGPNYFVFVVNGPQNTGIDTLQVGVAKMQNVLYSLNMTANGVDYTQPDEFLIYSTPTPIDLNQVSTFNVPLNPAVGKLQVSLKAHAGIGEVYLDILEPTNSLNFQGSGTTGTTIPGTRLRTKLTFNSTTNAYEGSMLAFPQWRAQVAFTILYTEGQTESYPVNALLNLVGGQVTFLEADFTGNSKLNISYLPWTTNTNVNYFAGFQVYININGGNPANYTGLTVQVKNNTSGVITTTNNIPLMYQNGLLSFQVSQLWGSGSYTLLSARLSDRDGSLADPNNLGTTLNIPFTIPGKVVQLSLDGRQNEEEYFVRQMIVALHGTLTAGSIFPGTTVYNTTRAIPLALPTQAEGTIVTSWSTSLGALNGNAKNYNLFLIVQAGEYRLQTIDLATVPYSVTGLSSGYTETRFKGRIPVNELIPFKYLNVIDFSRQDLPFGDITNWSQVVRLNNISINNYGSKTANMLSGSLPAALANLDMVSFQIFYTNLSGTLPPSYSNWTNLTTIQFRYNTNLGGTLPASWANFQKLTLMRFMNNNFSGAIPAEFAYYATVNMAITLNSNYFTCAPAALVNKYNLNITTQLNGTIGAC